MQSDWPVIRFGEVAKVAHGWPFKSELFAPDDGTGPVVVGIGNFNYSGGFRFHTTGRKIYKGDYPASFRLEPGDVLLVMTCQTEGGEILGIPGTIPGDGRVYLHNQRMGKVVVTRPDLVSKRFLYWLCLTRDFNDELTASATGTKILHTAPSRIEDCVFPLPPLDLQHRIARTLDELERRIETNERMNRELEALVFAVFSSWFVDFEPPTARAEGRKPFGMNDEIAALFPRDFEDGVPTGWTQESLSAAVTISKDQANPKEEPSDLFEHYSIPAYDDGKVPSRELGNTIQSNKFLVSENSILVSKLNPEIPRVWWPVEGVGPKSVCSTEFLVLQPRPEIPLSFLYCLVTERGFRDELCGLVTGTSNSHQRVKPDDFLRIRFVMPTREVLIQFDRIATPVFSRIHLNLRQRDLLRKLRDALLSPLIAGEIRLQDAEQRVGALLA